MGAFYISITPAPSSLLTGRSHFCHLAKLKCKTPRGTTFLKSTQSASSRRAARKPAGSLERRASRRTPASRPKRLAQGFGRTGCFPPRSPKSPPHSTSSAQCRARSSLPRASPCPPRPSRPSGAFACLAPDPGISIYVCCVLRAPRRCILIFSLFLCPCAEALRRSLGAGHPPYAVLLVLLLVSGYVVVLSETSASNSPRVGSRVA